MSTTNDLDSSTLRNWVVEYLSRVGQLKLMDSLTIEVTDRLRSTAGRYSCKSGKHLVELNAREESSHAQQTLGHELAHLLDWVVDRRSGHGPTWRAWTRRLGVAPKPCHDYAELDATKSRSAYTCRDCGLREESGRVIVRCSSCASPDLRV